MATEISPLFSEAKKQPKIRGLIFGGCLFLTVFLPPKIVIFLQQQWKINVSFGD
jgi:hypothetical protein